jgi:Xaa-Pro aminopeptidase
MMNREALDAVFIQHSANLFYFGGTVQNGLLCVPREGAPVFFVRKSYDRAIHESPLKDFERIGSMKELPALLSKRRITVRGRCGLELDAIPAFLYFKYHELFPGIRWCDCGSSLRVIRSVKTAWETDMIREAGRQLQAMYRAVPEFLTEKMTELRLFADLERVLRLEGQQGLIRTYRWGADIYHGLVAAGDSVDSATVFDGPIGSPGLYPGAPAGWSVRPIMRGEPVLIDMLGGYGGYHADQTRVFSIGRPSETFMKAHSFILDVRMMIEERIKPGALPSDLYETAVDAARKGGYEEYFMNYGEKQVRFIGHGIGIELDEYPVITGGNDIPLEAGNVFALEPKIVFPGKGAVGVEDDYLVTEDGFERLTDFPEEIQIL